MKKIAANIYLDENTQQYYILRKSFEKYIYYDCLVESCPSTLKLMRATQIKTTKNEHNHDEQKAKNSAAVASLKATIKEIALDPTNDESPGQIVEESMKCIPGITFPPGFAAKARKMIRNARFRSKYVSK